MARFLIPEDYTDTIKTEILTDITDGRITAIATAEDKAIGQLRQYIGGRYDINAILAHTGTERDSFIVMILIDLSLYHLYTASAPHQIPDHRKVRYDDAIQWLKDVGRGDLSATLPLLGDTSTGDTTSTDNPYLRISSDPKQRNDF